MKELLSLKNVHITMKKNNLHIVKGVDLSVYGGKTTVIVGESGSGKTMLIKAVTGILNRKNMQLKGEAYYNNPAGNRFSKNSENGINLFSLNERERRAYSSELALIMQNPMTAFDPSVKIGRQMSEGTRLPKVIARSKALSALEAVRLPRSRQLLNSYPYELSGGMLQRVMIAMALMSEASIIMADEPTTALDVVNQNLVLDELNILKNEGLGILFVTHDFIVARKIADYIAVMNKGEFVESGPAQRVLDSPQHDYTKALLEASILRRREETPC